MAAFLAVPSAGADDASALARQGMEALKRGELATAEELCGRARKLAPDSQAVYTCLYNVFNNTNRFDVALAEAAAVLKRKPKDDFHTRAMARTYSRRGEKRLKVKDYDGAQGDFEAALRVVANEQIALDELGYIHYQRKNYREAVRYFNRTLKMDLNFAPNYVWRGRCFRALGRPVMALADFERAKNLKPDVWSGIQGDIDGATEEYLGKSKARQPQARPVRGMGAIMYDMNSLHAEWKGEIAYYTAQLGARPRDSDAYYFRGALRFELGDGGSAAVDFKKAIELYPGFWGMYLPDLVRQAESRR